MSNAPAYSIEPQNFWTDPYPDFAKMPPIAYVPELDATLITRHADIAVNEKKDGCVFFLAATGVDDGLDG